MDWMAQGTRITGNILYDNTTDDLFMEVNHGPYLVDNNLFLSELSLRDWSEGGAYAHNLFSGKIEIRKVLDRFTPYHLPHSTKVAGLRNIYLGDNRFYNNIFMKRSNDAEEIQEGVARFYGLGGYRIAGFENRSAGNLYYNGSKPDKNDRNSLVEPAIYPSIELEEKEGNVYLKMELDQSISAVQTSLVTTKILGSTLVSEAIFEHPDGSPYKLDTDFLGNKRDENGPTPGPFEKSEPGKGTYKVW